MDSFVEKYVGKRRARELLADPAIKAQPRLRHELFLTAVLHRLVQEARKKDIRMGLVGSLGMAHEYGQPSARRWTNDIDLEIPNTISAEEINEVLDMAGLKPAKKMQDVYTPDTLISRNPYSAGKSVDIIIGTECPDYVTFQEHSRRIAYQNHAIATLGLPPIAFRQFTPAVLALSKAMALADPNRQVATGKMGDIHDLTHALHAIRRADIDHVVDSRMLEGLVLPRDDENLATVIHALQKAYPIFNQWQKDNLVNPNALATEQQYRHALDGVESLFRPRGYEPLTAIRTKIQLAGAKELKRLARRFDPHAPRGQIRSGLIARALEPELKRILAPQKIRALSRRAPDAVVAELTRLMNPR